MTSVTIGSHKDILEDRSDETPSLIYLDNNATTLIDPQVAALLGELYPLRLANPSSQHAAGRRARQILENAREELLSGCGARNHGMESDQLLFTSGGTEANNLALMGLASLRPGAIVVSSIEHPSVLAAAEHLERSGRRVLRLPCDSSGVIEIKPLTEWLEQTMEPVSLVSLMLANNETGVLQQVKAAAELCRARAVPIHCDAVQGLGKIPMRFDSLGVDAMTITAHKLHGPVGIGALLLRHGIAIAPQLFGGFQQMGLRPGTEMPVLAAGFALAVRIASQNLEERHDRVQSLRNSLESQVQAAVPDAVILGRGACRLPNTSNIAFPGLDRQAIQLALDLAGVACSTGSACASGSSQPSHVLAAMGLSTSWIRGAVRFSLSHETTQEEINAAANKIKDSIRRLSKHRP